MNNSIDKSYAQLSAVLKAQKTIDTTALGPAMMTSIALAGQGKSGSSVVVCTDGMANVGRHDLEYYQQIGDYARTQGVTVNIVAIQGD